MGIEPWGKPYFLPENLDMPAHTKTPSRVFVAPMSDLGHFLIETNWLSKIVDAMKAAPWHTYIVLTKRPRSWMACLPKGVWAGVTVENQSHWKRVDDLVHWHVGISFVSVEPMLGPVTLRGLAGPLAWVICGPETGRGARPFRGEWIDALASESECFFDKRETWKRREFPLHNAAGQTPAAHKEKEARSECGNVCVDV